MKLNKKMDYAKSFSKTNPKVAIILVQAKEDIEDLIECLESLNELIYDNFYAILVNNGIKNLDLSKFLNNKYRFEIHILKTEKNLGFAGGNNFGIKQALSDKSNYILLLNNDTIVDKEFLINLLNFMTSKRKIGIVGPVILKYSDNKIESAGGIIKLWRGEAPLLNHNRELSILKGSYRYVDYISGCAMLIHSKVFEVNGVLNNEYFPGYYEDTEFCYRARKREIKTYCVFNAKVWHKGSRSYTIYSQEERETILIKNQILFMFNNVNILRFFIYLIYFTLTYPFTNKFHNFSKRVKNIINSIFNLLKIKFFKSI